MTVQPDVARRARDGEPSPISASAWWRDAVIYQVYVRSFTDGDGDGIGDIAGLRSRLPYVRELGVDAIWINPWYRSPMVDAGYDVADYRDIDPRFGTLAEAEALVGEAHALGLRVIVDLVPNHTSDRHDWFEAALAAGPASAERGRYWFRAGRGADGELPPNDWRSEFGGSAWTRVHEPNGTPGEWYLHLFAPEQPDLNWAHPDVVAEFEEILRFWLDRGVDGFRIDVAHGLVKHPELPDIGYAESEARARTAADMVDHPHWDREEVHEIYRGWRRVSNGYDGERKFVAEAWVGDADRLARYLRPDALHTAFNFDFLACAWDASELRGVIEATLSAHDAVGAPATWVLSNHDVARHVTRYGRLRSGLDRDWTSADGAGVDLELGTRRARAAALLALALPGGAYVYQGEELGLWEVEDIPEPLLQDPGWARSRQTRDGCRVPLPWSNDAAAFGFSPAGATSPPWLPQPAAWEGLAAEAQARDPRSMLSLYRAALRLRRTHPALGDGTLAWDHDAPPGTLGFAREPGFYCLINLSSEAVRVPAHHAVLLASAALDGGSLPPDAAVWLAREPT